uniref:Uncharacterized protein n=1 Tax=Raphanus sativus TaxID=3726 RepID=A0A650GAV0_RAPSA|nr:hypothetical protein [Raphanus sativus]QGW48494.1 hypothetical protein [Raphanus sativus]
MSLEDPLKSPNKGEKAISRPFAIARRAARLYTAWLRYRSYVVVIGLKSGIPAIQAYFFLVLEASPEASKTRERSFVDKARYVLD